MGAAGTCAGGSVGAGAAAVGAGTGAGTSAGVGAAGVGASATGAEGCMASINSSTCARDLASKPNSCKAVTKAFISCETGGGDTGGEGGLGGALLAQVGTAATEVCNGWGAGPPAGWAGSGCSAACLGATLSAGLACSGCAGSGTGLGLVCSGCPGLVCSGAGSGAGLAAGLVCSGAGSGLAADWVCSGSLSAGLAAGWDSGFGAGVDRRSSSSSSRSNVSWSNLCSLGGVCWWA